MAKLRILLADDHRLMIEAVRVALEEDGDFEVVGWTTDATKIVSLVTDTTPDVVVLDVRMPLLDGIACLNRIKQRAPTVKVVMLSASEDPTLASQALEGGASAFVLKQIDPRDLGSVLRQVVNGTVFQTIGVPATLSSSRQATEAGLTAKEQEVLAALARGPVEPADREGALAGRADGEVPPVEHLPQARGAEPDRSRAARRSARVREQPDLPRGVAAPPSRSSSRHPLLVLRALTAAAGR